MKTNATTTTYNRKKRNCRDAQFQMPANVVDVSVEKIEMEFLREKTEERKESQKKKAHKKRTILNLRNCGQEGDQ